MYLVATRAHDVTIGDMDLTVRFEAGERIHTENSYKFTVEDVADRAKRADLVLEDSWYDDERWFGEHLLRREDGDGPG